MTRRAAWAAVSVPAAAAAASLALSWQTWIHPFIDSSREMMVPARLAGGERLYRDVVYYYGPLGPWLNSAVLRLFGRRWALLEIVGIALAAATLAALGLLVRRAGSALSAVAATALAAAVCLGAPNGGAFVFPYSFDSLLAIAASLASLALFAGPPGRLRDAAAGAAAAVALASKPEVGVAALVVIGVAALRSSTRRIDLPRAVRIGAVGGAASLAAYAFAFRGVPVRALAREGPLVLFDPPAEWRRVYGLISGFDDPARNLSRMATAAFLGLLVLAAALLAARLEARQPAARRPARIAWGAAVAAALAFFLAPSRAWLDARLPPLLLPLPLAAAAAALWCLRRPLDHDGRARFLLFGFSGAIASRVALNFAYESWTTPYSILVFPALAGTACVLALDVLPARRPAGPALRRNLAIVFAALAAAALIRLGRWSRADRWTPVRTAAGTIRLPAAQAGPVREALAYLGSRARPGDALAAFPEAGFFNFVTGLTNPLREDQILPGHLDAAAERRVAARLANRAPRFVLLANQPAAAFGPVSFGQDYARVLWQHVRSDYHLAAAFGNRDPEARIGTRAFFLRIYERNARATAAHATIAP
jgi:hypothetical protein